MRSARRTAGALIVATALSLSGLTSREAAACPNCKEAVSATSSEAANMSEGFNWSVLFMLSVPFSLAGTGVVLVHRAVKNGTFPEL